MRMKAKRNKKKSLRKINQQKDRTDNGEKAEGNLIRDEEEF